MHKELDDLREKALQFKRYLAHPEQWQRPQGPARDGHGWARLIANDPRALKGVTDHAAVAKSLMKAGEVDTLVRVVASGLLNGWALRFYRLALEAWLSR